MPCRSSTVFIYRTNLWTPSRFIWCDRKGQEWEELRVAARGDRLVFEVGEPERRLAGQVRAPPPRAKGTIAELRPAALAWIHKIASRLRNGFVLVIDYGFSREKLLSPYRTKGTFSCYRAHRRDARPLDGSGEKDITAHVDFTALAGSAVDAGFRIEGYADQHHYLVGASQDLLKELDRPPPIRFAKDASIAPNTPPS